MEELSETLEGLDRSLADLDVTAGGQVFAITEKGRGKEEKGQRIFVNGQDLPVPAPIRHPILRALDETRRLLADSRTGESKNAWILRTTGEVDNIFRAGDAIMRERSLSSTAATKTGEGSTAGGWETGKPSASANTPAPYVGCQEAASCPGGPLDIRSSRSRTRSKTPERC